MNILAIDTSGNVCAAAVLRDERILSESYMDDKKTHSKTIAPMVDEVLSRVGLAVQDIDLFACAVGPGSFTGLRIGVAMVKAFAQASRRPVVGVNTLDALAQNMSGTDEIVCPIIDARRSDVYTAMYKNGERITDYRAMRLDEVLAAQHGQKTVFVGDAALNFEEKILAASGSFRIAQCGIALQRAGSVGLLAYKAYQNGEAADSHSIEPFYLRETQAERVYAQKHGEQADAD